MTVTGLETGGYMQFFVLGPKIKGNPKIRQIKQMLLVLTYLLGSP